jgi:PAS domain S-box-containing protein/putative nucleotidyltransferase with HDIG domain
MADKGGMPPDARELARLQAELEAAQARERAAQETRRALLAMLEDLEESRREIEQARHEWVSAMDAVLDPIFMHDHDYCILRANRAYAERAGMDVRDVIGKPYWQVFPKIDNPLPGCIHALENQQRHEEELRLASGEIYLIRYYPILDGEGNYLYSLHLMQDVTEKRRAEDALHESEARFRNLVEASSDWVWEVDTHGIYTYVSPKVMDILGYRPDEVIGKSPFDLMPPEETERAQPEFLRLASEKQPILMLENINRHKDGRLVVLETSGVPILDAAGEFRGYRGMDRDITERKQAETNLKLFRELLDHSNDGIHIADPASSRFLDVNEAACRELGYTREELLQLRVIDIQTNIHDLSAWQAHVQQLRTSGPVVVEFEAQRKDGSRFPVEASVREVTAGGRDYVIAVVRDITERKRSEEALRSALRAQRTLSACNEILIHATRERQLLADMCRNIIEQGGYRMAWIGFVKHDPAKSIRPVASAGHDEGYTAALDKTWAETERGQGPTGRAVRLGTPQLAADILTDPHYAPWREAALKRGYAAGIALPLKEEDGEVFGVLDIYDAEPNAFDEAEIRLLQELADDLAFGILSLRTRQERDHYQLEHLKSAERLKDALVGTIRAIALTVEKRDPYTAGHQSRVAELAAAIAGELGLDTDRIEGLKLGGMIHDIGKIYVPAEILNRPGRLTEHEFGMIKTHSEVGYDIIKDVKFPWPVADMVLQHHERMDGSGYPQGLKGEQIILEARILAVADVVEAITAHRPYRPAIGIDKALAEIEGKRGQIYDAEVVDACLRLFRERGFRLE